MCSVELFNCLIVELRTKSKEQRQKSKDKRAKTNKN